jgi:hypothetical protein
VTSALAALFGVDPGGYTVGGLAGMDPSASRASASSAGDPKTSDARSTASTKGALSSLAQRQGAGCQLAAASNGVRPTTACEQSIRAAAAPSRHESVSSMPTTGAAIAATVMLAAAMLGVGSLLAPIGSRRRHAIRALNRQA